MNQHLYKKHNIPLYQIQKSNENNELEEKKESSLSSSYTIICVKWGKKYGSEYVNKLSRAIKKYNNNKYIIINI